MSYKTNHEPVCQQEIVSLLSFDGNHTYVDCTLGFAGHAKAILDNTNISTLVGIDMDAKHIAFAKETLQPYKENHTLIFEHAPFRNLKAIAQKHGLEGKITSILFDFGICSAHVDNSERGFSFQEDGPLDMRMNQTTGITAADIVNRSTESELLQILYTYGEERKAKKIVRAILLRREQDPITSTKELAELIENVAKDPREKTHPATRTFQALRIAVNDELEQIKEAVQDAIELLAPGGRIITLTYHSLEDRIVKQIFKEESRPYHYDSDDITAKPIFNQKINLLTKKPLLPKEEEICYNKRSRSAKLRAAEKR